MMRKFPAPIHNVISALTKLPGVGPKTAQRYVFSLLRLNPHELDRMAYAISSLKTIEKCQICFAYSETKECDICKNEKRINNIICVVSESRDIATIEATNTYQGKYFVLGGRLNPIEGVTPDTLNVNKLIAKIALNPEITEIILAFSPDVHGETTIMYLSRKIKEMNRKVTRLARGLPLGADIEYTDEVTLGDALLGRRET